VLPKINCIHGGRSEEYENMRRNGRQVRYEGSEAAETASQQRPVLGDGAATYGIQRVWQTAVYGMLAPMRVVR